jgi:hypothetical protein
MKNKIKLVMLYGLRYPTNPALNTLLDILRSQNCGEEAIAEIKTMIRFGEGYEREESVLEKTKNVFKGLKVFYFC